MSSSISTRPWSRRAFLASAGSVARLRGQEDRRPPNIVFIVADDLGWRDLSCYGSGYYRTPNIDGLAKQGIRFTSAYACPNCAPTRASLLTGLYSPRTGIFTVGEHQRGEEKDRKMIAAPNRTTLALEHTTYAETLKAAGYATGHVGKWHMGSGQYRPEAQGFDVNAGGNASGSPASYLSPFRNAQLTDGPAGQYLTDRLSLEAVRFLTANQHRPFLLNLWFYAVHKPIQPRPDLHERWKRVPGAGGQSNAAYAAMIDSLDQGVGRVLDALDSLRLRESTMVVFYSDNGGVGGYRRAGVIDEDITDNAPLRGGKGMLYEGGIRVPLVVRYPGTVRAALESDEPIMCVDFLATMADAAGVRAPSTDGTSFFSVLRDGGRSSTPRPPIYWHFPGYLQGRTGTGSWRTSPGGVIRKGDWKLIEFFESNTVELYNLREDVSEAHDLAPSRREVASGLHQELRSWRSRTAAPMPRTKATGGVAVPGF